MTLPLDELERAARIATPGNWVRIGMHLYQEGGQRLLWSISATEPAHDNQFIRDAFYISLANPQTILELIAAYRTASEEAQMLHNALHRAQDRLDETRASLLSAASVEAGAKALQDSWDRHDGLPPLDFATEESKTLARAAIEAALNVALNKEEG